MARQKKTTKRKQKRKGYSGMVVNTDRQLIQALQRLKRMKSAHRCRVIAKSNDAFIRRLCTALRRWCNNSGSIVKRLSAAKLRQVKQHRTALRKLVNSRVSIQKKRRLLSQRGSGGILDTLAQLPLAPVRGAMKFLALGENFGRR